MERREKRENSMKRNIMKRNIMKKNSKKRLVRISDFYDSVIW